MKLLLDTQILLWAAADSERLPSEARQLIESDDNVLMFSAASIWEVAIKTGLARADFVVDAEKLRRGLGDNGYQELAVTARHAAAILELPPRYKDPFDRMLLAQCHVEGLRLVLASTVAFEGPGRRQRAPAAAAGIKRSAAPRGTGLRISRPQEPISHGASAGTSASASIAFVTRFRTTCSTCTGSALTRSDPL